MAKQKKDLMRAEVLAKEQKEISVSQFFERNRHLLGFDNPIKAISTSVKEMVDNSLDACQEMNVLPEVIVQLRKLSETKFEITVEDNGPGIVKANIPNVFAKLLFGSKFARMRQSRGQQGIGVSASVLYGQLTTGKPARITSKISPKKPSHYYELHIDINRNEPEIVIDKEVEWLNKDHGTKVVIELEGKYQQGKLGIAEYIKQTAISNPQATITFINPNKEVMIYKRVTTTLPKEPKEIKPHPYGVELGILMRMLKNSSEKSLKQFFVKEFSRTSEKVVTEICRKAGVDIKTSPHNITHQEAEKIWHAMNEVKIMAPPTDCLSPITEDILMKGLKKEIDAEFFAATTRPPAVYRGMPFQIECAIAYGGGLPGDELVRLMRFANRVPLQYQQSACSITKSTIQTAWKNYNISQSRGALPTAPAVFVVHIASVWVPFTSESKEAIAHYPEITKEIKLALQECGRKVASYIRKKKKSEFEAKKRSYIEKYIPHIGGALKEILSLSEKQETDVVKKLKIQLDESRGGK